MSLALTTGWIYTELSLFGIMSILVTIIIFIELWVIYGDHYGKRDENKMKEFNESPQSNNQSSDKTSNDSKENDLRSRSASASSRSQAKNPVSKPFLSLQLLPIFSYLFYALNGYIRIPWVLHIGIFSGCFLTGMSGICYVLGKLFMYYVFLYRLYTIYSDSKFAY
eukprot:836696_1